LPKIVQEGKGKDWAYAGWLIKPSGILEYDNFLPIVILEYMDTEPESFSDIPLTSYGEEVAPETSFPLPLN
jgi:hypothetical protein